jgi:hypothetical protein
MQLARSMPVHSGSSEQPHEAAEDDAVEGRVIKITYVFDCDDKEGLRRERAFAALKVCATPAICVCHVFPSVEIPT